MRSPVLFHVLVALVACTPMVAPAAAAPPVPVAGLASPTARAAREKPSVQRRLTRARFDTPPGGVMTTEVGAITGSVEVWLAGNRVRIAYTGALDSYTVAGSRRGRSLTQVVALLTRDPGTDAAGNPLATSLA